jgi:hypothetical protein
LILDLHALGKWFAFVKWVVGRKVRQRTVNPRQAGSIPAQPTCLNGYDGACPVMVNTPECESGNSGFDSRFVRLFDFAFLGRKPEACDCVSV